MAEKRTTYKIQDIEGIGEVQIAAPSSGQNFPQIVTHILQKAFFRHALTYRNSHV